ncbi:MAG TPA: hypothetical protein VIW24_15625 [Aldersonia sp.]
MRLTRSRLVKLAGLAGAVGVAATGALVARNERKRRAYTPDEVREQLHVRYAAATTATVTPPSAHLSSDNASEGDKKCALGGVGRRLRVRVQRLARRDQ